MSNKGQITMIKGQIVEVEFIGDKPSLNHILLLEEDNSLVLEVFASSSGSRFFCLALTDSSKMKRGAVVVNTGKSLTVPATKKALGRVFDVFGNAHDGKGSLSKEPQMEVFRKNQDLSHDDVKVYSEILRTGIKCIDFFAPIIRGGRAGLFGGAGVGKTILLTELINNIVIARTVSELSNRDSSVAISDKEIRINKALENQLTSGPFGEVIFGGKNHVDESQETKLSKDSADKISTLLQQDDEDNDYEYVEDVKAVSVFAAVGERSREAQELVETLYETKVMPYVSLILGQMGENPGVRFRTAYSAAALAEYFRDVLGKNVLFFMDNVYRFAQAGYELSTLMNLLPSEDGYQPTLNSELGSFHERLVSTKSASVTVIEAVFVPSDDVTDYGVRSIFPFLNTSVVFSREVYQQGRFPAIDFLQSNSSALNPDMIGEKHYSTYLDAKGLLEKASKIERIASLVGEHELSVDDQTIFKRTKILRNYMTQSFHVVEAQTGQPGVSLQIEDVVEDVSRILAGEFDEIDARKFLYVGRVDEGKNKK